MQVPVMNQRTVQPTGLPGAMQQTPDLGTALAVQRQQGEELGQKIEGAGNAWAQVVQQEQAEKNEADAKTAHAAFVRGANELLWNPQSGYLTKKGDAALEAKADTEDQIDQLRKSLGDSIQSPRARQLFDQQATQSATSYLNQMEVHAGREHQQYLMTASEQRSTAFGQSAVLSYNPMPGADNSVYQHSVAGLEAEVRDRGESMLGLRGEDLTNYVRQNVAPVHAQVVEHLAENNEGPAAKAYLEAHRDQIPDPEVQDKLRKLVDASNQKTDAALLAISVKGRIQGIDKQESFLDDQLKGGKITAEVHSMALQQLRADHAQEEAQKADADRAVLGNVWNLKNRNPSATWTDLPPSQIAYIRQRGLGSSVDALLNKQPGLDDAALWTDLMRQSAEDPNAFAKLDLVKFHGNLNDGHYNQLVERQAAINKGDLKAQYITKLQQDAIRAGLADIRAAGINVNAKEGTSAATELQKFEATLQEALTQEVSARQAAGKPAMTPDEAKALVQGMVKQQALAGTGIFGFFQTKGPAYRVAADIPEAARMQIEDALRSRGRPVTPQAVLDLYNRKKGQQ